MQFDFNVTALAQPGVADFFRAVIARSRSRHRPLPHAQTTVRHCIPGRCVLVCEIDTVDQLSDAARRRLLMQMMKGAHVGMITLRAKAEGFQYSHRMIHSLLRLREMLQPLRTLYRDVVREDLADRDNADATIRLALRHRVPSDSPLHAAADRLQGKPHFKTLKPAWTALNALFQPEAQQLIYLEDAHSSPLDTEAGINQWAIE
jgi:hypothetical protein